MAIDLKRAVFFGQCVEVVYKTYEAAPNDPTPTLRLPLPDNYKFVAWVQMQDFNPDGTPTPYTFYGLIATSPSNPTKAVLAIRGTESPNEWFEDLESIFLDPMPQPGWGQVGAGFLKVYQTLRVVYPVKLGVEFLKGSFADQVAQAIQRYWADAPKPAQIKAIEVTGHSLGAALATIYVADNNHTPKAPVPLICTFASPRVGDPKFASKFDKLGIESWRIVNEPDFVPTQPFLGFQHVHTEYLYNSAWSVVFTLPCLHALETYLHLLDPKQPLQSQCIPTLTVTAPSRARTRLIPAVAALSAATESAARSPAETIDAES
jgi:Lipase (class 3)